MAVNARTEEFQHIEVFDMHGWDVPGADPSAYQQTEPQMGGMNLG